MTNFPCPHCAGTGELIPPSVQRMRSLLTKKSQHTRELAEQLGVSYSNASKLLKQLHRAGVVRREGSFGREGYWWKKTGGG